MDGFYIFRCFVTGRLFLYLSYFYLPFTCNDSDQVFVTAQSRAEQRIKESLEV